MSYLMAAFFCCLMALLVGAAGLACLIAGVGGIGTALLLFAASAGYISHRLGKAG